MTTTPLITPEEVRKIINRNNNLNDAQVIDIILKTARDYVKLYNENQRLRDEIDAQKEAVKFTSSKMEDEEDAANYLRKENARLRDALGSYYIAREALKDGK